MCVTKAISLSRWLLFTVIVVAALTAATAAQSLDPGAIQEWVKSAGASALLAFVLGYALATVLFAPGSVIALAGGALFGIKAD